jgi:RHS repeat-associated protein
MARRWTVAALGLLALAPAAHAEIQNPNHGRGFEPEKAYHFNQVDHVNLFNGTLNVTIPIGPAYALDGGMSYSLTLAYGSNPWEWDQFCYPSATGNVCQYRSYPTFEDNAGFGWRLHLGRLLHPDSPPYNSSSSYVYESPDGATHQFYFTLHQQETPDAGVFYTRDNSYLRLKEAAVACPVTGQPGRLCDTIEFPDGTVHWFNPQGELEQIRNRASSWMKVTRHEDSQGRYTLWEIRDSAGRYHKIHFAPSDILLNGVPFDPPTLSNRDEPDPNEPAWADPAKLVRIDRILLESPVGLAEYDFRYEDDMFPDRTFIAPRRADSSGTGQQGPQLAYTVPVLVAVDLPDGTQWFIGKNNYLNNGRLTGLTFPTAGRVEYEYGTYQFPDIDPFRKGDIPVTQSPYISNTGVRKRILYNRANSGILGTYTYTQNSPVTHGSGSTAPVSTATTVTDPLGHRRIHYFRANPALPWHGLPVHPTVVDGQGRHLSVETYHANGTQLRSEYARYDADAVSSTSELGGNADIYNVNRRVDARRTVYHDDGGHEKTVDMSDFDGLGHYRLTREASSFSQVWRERYTRYNEESGSWDNGTYQAWPASEPWILGTYDLTRIEDGNGASKRQVRQTAFDHRGLLVAERMQVGPNPTTRDVVRIYRRHVTTGNVTTESHHGGDGANLSTTAAVEDLPGLLSDGSADYVLDHTYQHGLLATSQYRGAPWYLVEQVVGRSTGKPVTSWDPAGIRTDYSYDALGRLVFATPETGHGAETKYQYTTATPTTPARLSIFRRTEDNGMITNLTRQDYLFDGLGRMVEEQRVMPEGQWAYRRTTYGPAGNLASKSIWSYNPSPPYSTVYERYDPFGRPGRIVPPAGGPETVTFLYRGDRVVERTANMGVTGTGSTVGRLPVTTREHYDTLGRLLRVEEDAAFNPPRRSTTYGYDPVDRLTGVNQGVQTRSFAYDGRGFMTQECHPEKGTASNNGCIYYLDLDARGHAGRIVDGPSDLAYQYDQYERLTEVREASGPSPRVLQEYQYVDYNFSGQHNAGKLYSATQHNYFVTPDFAVDFPVKEIYRYGGVGGRVSRLDTVINGTADTYVQNYTHDELGNVVSQTYPTCSQCGAGAGTPSRTLTHTYDRGFQVGLPGWLTDVDYHANGLDLRQTHVNGVERIQANGPFGTARPGSITVSKGPQSLYSSGTFTYDGFGNITGIGSDYYRYDRLGRLAEGSMYQDSQNRHQQYVYDAYDNMIQLQTWVGGTTTTRGFAISTQSNRLDNTSYDYAGNQLTYGIGSDGWSYDWTPQNRLWRLTGPGLSHYYAYSASGERVLTYDGLTGESDHHLRDLSGQLVREFHFDGAGTWTWHKDWIRRSGGQLVGTVDRQGQLLHAHLDHLGTPRVFTNASGISVRRRHYYPFGEQAVVSGPADINMAFTGHERDENAPGTVDDLDYMHQRYYSAQMGRFLSFDPGASGRTKVPASWNKYAYARNNPLKFVDPDGEDVVVFLVGPSGRNFPNSAFGHAAIYASSGDESAGLSYGGDDNVGDTPGEFVDTYSRQGRKVTMFHLETTEQQDKAVLSFIKKNQDGNTDRDALGAGLMARENCTTAVCNALKAGGLVSEDSDVGGAAGGPFHSPSELFDALLTGELSDIVQLVVVIDRPVEQ